MIFDVFKRQGASLNTGSSSGWEKLDTRAADDVRQANEHASSLSADEQRAAAAQLTERAGKEWLERRKAEREPSAIGSITEAAALFANAGRVVDSVTKKHVHFAFLNDDVYYVYLQDSPRPFVVRADTGAVYDVTDFETRFPELGSRFPGGLEE